MMACPSTLNDDDLLRIELRLMGSKPIVITFIRQINIVEEVRIELTLFLFQRQVPYH